VRCADLDLQKGIWTIPRERSKSNVANEVPLSHWRLRLISKVKLRLHRLIAAQRHANGLPVMPEWWLHGLRRTRRPASTND
jgi:integrase